MYVWDAIQERELTKWRTRPKFNVHCQATYQRVGSTLNIGTCWGTAREDNAGCVRELLLARELFDRDWAIEYTKQGEILQGHEDASADAACAGGI